MQESGGMSNPDSFIDEVTEEVRRDRLYRLMRKWGWVAILGVIVLVGWASWIEWSAVREARRAQAFGDSLLTALAAPDMPARRAALAAVTPDGEDQASILGLLEATVALNGEDADVVAARARLFDLAETPGLSTIYRHLALLKAMLAGGTGDAARDGTILAELATPGAPFRPLAVEMQAHAALDAGDEATALTLLRTLSQDAESTESLRRRALQTIVALGASPDPV